MTLITQIMPYIKMNSVHGGVIVPRGTSLVGLDLRKTKIRPKYVPNPTNDTIERTALFRVTEVHVTCGSLQCLMPIQTVSAMLIILKTHFVPNFSHHKLTCF